MDHSPLCTPATTRREPDAETERKMLWQVVLGLKEEIGRLREMMGRDPHEAAGDKDPHRGEAETRADRRPTVTSLIRYPEKDLLHPDDGAHTATFDPLGEAERRTITEAPRTQRRQQTENSRGPQHHLITYTFIAKSRIQHRMKAFTSLKRLLPRIAAVGFLLLAMSASGLHPAVHAQRIVDKLRHLQEHQHLQLPDQGLACVSAPTADFRERTPSTM